MRWVIISLIPLEGREDRSGLCEEAMMKSLCKGIMNARLDGKVTKCIIWRSDWMI